MMQPLSPTKTPQSKDSKPHFIITLESWDSTGKLAQHAREGFDGMVMELSPVSLGELAAETPQNKDSKPPL